MVVLWSALASCIWFRTGDCNRADYPASRYRVSRITGSRLRFSALSTLVGSCRFTCLWLRREIAFSIGVSSAMR